jgi:hypothetical protein
MRLAVVVVVVVVVRVMVITFQHIQQVIVFDVRRVRAENAERLAVQLRMLLIRSSSFRLRGFLSVLP